MNKLFDLSSEWFKDLQSEICTTIEKLDGPMKTHVSPAREGWEQSHKTIYGNVFEKGTVNFSKVTGEFDPKFAKEIPGTEEDISYEATGISVVLHPCNPKVPAMHFNTRYLKTGIEWFGGGMDFTPCLPFDKESYHAELKKMCDEYDKTYYPKFSKACDEYFYLPHRKEPRGIGGIFFDYKKENWEKDFSFVREVGISFKNIFREIILKKYKKKWSNKQREIQLEKRGRYVEFNLLYDRGTKFGLQTNGNVEAILMSLPPVAKWK